MGTMTGMVSAVQSQAQGGLVDWLPAPKDAYRQPTGAYTMKCADGYYRDPNKLESYVENSSNDTDNFWGVSRQGAFQQAAQQQMNQAYGQMQNAIIQQMYQGQQLANNPGMQTAVSQAQAVQGQNQSILGGLLGSVLGIGSK